MQYMKLHRYIIILAGAGAILSSCNNFLEPYPAAIRSEDYIWANPSTVQGLVHKCYDWMPTNYNNNEGAYLDCATDNAVRTSRTEAISRFANGTLSTSDDPFETYWDRDYKAIRNLNMFLKDDRGYNTRFLLNDHHNELLRNRLKGEAFALRAWFQWDLLQKFGGRATNGELLGFPILLEPVDISEVLEQNIDFKRNTYEKCVMQIVADCDSAYKYLPIAHRDFLVDDSDDAFVLGGQNWGRMDGITTVAIKSQVYLTWASPRFNPAGDVSRWEKAARFAKEVMDFKLDVDGAVSGGFHPTRHVNWFDPNNPEIVFSSRYNDNSDAMEKMFWPGGFQGDGTMGATQELVDAFPMADGYPAGQSPTYAYDPQNPYANRDPRFYSVIFYNGRTVTVGNASPRASYTFENWIGGKDAAGVNSSNSLTNYHIKKFVFTGLDWSENNPNRQPHSKFFIRWAHMCLTFAEAANHVVGPTGTIDGLSPKEAVGYLRSRMTYDEETGLANDPYLDLIALEGREAFDEFVRNERRIETCFEGLRFFDLRRWTTTLGELNKAVHGATIVRNSDGTFNYDLGTEVDSRSFTSAYLPIPYREVRGVNGLLQNEGWDTWQ